MPETFKAELAAGLFDDEALTKIARISESWAAYEFTPSEFASGVMVAPSSTTLALSLTSFTASAAAFASFHNLDPTNYMSITYVSIGSADTSRTVRVYAGEAFIIPDLDPSTDLTIQFSGAPGRFEYLVVQE